MSADLARDLLSVRSADHVYERLTEQFPHLLVSVETRGGKLYVTAVRK